MAKEEGRGASQTAAYFCSLPHLAETVADAGALVRSSCDRPADGLDWHHRRQRRHRRSGSSWSHSTRFPPLARILMLLFTCQLQRVSDKKKGKNKTLMTLYLQNLSFAGFEKEVWAGENSLWIGWKYNQNLFRLHDKVSTKNSFYLDTVLFAIILSFSIATVHEMWQLSPASIPRCSTNSNYFTPSNCSITTVCIGLFSTCLNHVKWFFFLILSSKAHLTIYEDNIFFLSFLQILHIHPNIYGLLTTQHSDP